MLKITCDDIQGISDAASLMDFLREELALPIKADATLEQIARPFPLPYLRLEGTVAAQVIECQELTVRPMDASGTRQPFLIRFREKAEYPGILYHVGEGLQRQGYVPADFGFLCVDEQFRPFAFASFEGAELIIRSWGENKASIHIDTAHEIPANFFPVKRRTPTLSPASDDLLAKLDNTGTPLSQHWNIYGVSAYSNVFVLDDSKRAELIAADAKSQKLIKPLVQLPSQGKWKPVMAHLIWIPSSRDESWPWSGADNVAEAEQIFDVTYPSISAHIKQHRDRLKTFARTGKFYWELHSGEVSSMLHPKIIYPIVGNSMRACYDAAGAFFLTAAYFIPTDDLSLLAILNSRLFDWYARAKYQIPNRNRLSFNRANLKGFPIADRREDEKTTLSNYVQLILDDSHGADVTAHEEEIDAWVYKLYELTPAEIALIEENR